jgi:two-component system nitrate/nitrite response regulator NarL
VELGSTGTVLIGANALLREGLARILSGANFQILVSASFIDDSIASSLPRHQTILLIIEASGDFGTAIRQIEAFKDRCPTGRVVVLAHQLQPREVVLAFAFGANAYLVSATTSEVFIKSLELVMLGETILPPTVLNLLYPIESNSDSGNERRLDHDTDNHGRDDPSKIDKEDHTDGVSDGGAEVIEGAMPKMDDSSVPRLSPQQRLILRYLIKGESNKTIARNMHITEGTVKLHVKAALRKIRVQNRTQAAIWAINNGAFISAENVDSSATTQFDPVSVLAGVEVLPPRQNGAPASPQEIKFGGNNGALSDSDLARKVTDRKYD